MLKNEKVELVGELSEQMQGKSLVFVDYEGMDMLGFDDVRVDIRKHGSIVKVVKNTLLRRVMEKTDNAALVSSMPDDFFSGMTAIGFAEGENFSVAGKAILKAEKQAQVKIKGGVHEGAVLTADAVRLLASIPSKEELYGILVGALSSIVGKLVVVLDEVKATKE